jgi:hypothetical protein
MKGIIVFDEGGVPLASVGFDSLEVSPGMFSSFMSAMQTYACNLSGGEVNRLELGAIQIILGRLGRNHIITLHSSIDQDADWNHEIVVDLIKGEDHQLDDDFLTMLRELLTDEQLSIEEAKLSLDDKSGIL